MLLLYKVRSLPFFLVSSSHHVFYQNISCVDAIDYKYLVLLDGAGTICIHCIIYVLVGCVVGIPGTWCPFV